MSLTEQNLINDLRRLTGYVNHKLVWKETRGRRKEGAEIGFRHSAGYRQTSFQGKRYMLHSLVFAYHHGYFPKMIDHIDGDRLNNRIENLRECDIKQNGYNSKKRIDNTSGHKGVSWSKSVNKWYVRIHIGDTYKYLGVYDDFDEACLVADKARLLNHKEFANNGSRKLD